MPCTGRIACRWIDGHLRIVAMEIDDDLPWPALHQLPHLSL